MVKKGRKREKRVKKDSKEVNKEGHGGWKRCGKMWKSGESVKKCEKKEDEKVKKNEKGKRKEKGWKKE